MLNAVLTRSAGIVISALAVILMARLLGAEDY